MEFIKKCCQCMCCSYVACGQARFIDMWHGVEACGKGNLYCSACCWTLCAPLFIDCKMGDFGKAMDNCVMGIKYCLFGCALQCVGICDGCYNCLMIMSLACT